MTLALHSFCPSPSLPISPLPSPPSLLSFSATAAALEEGTVPGQGWRRCSVEGTETAQLGLGRYEGQRWYLWCLLGIGLPGGEEGREVQGRAIWNCQGWSLEGRSWRETSRPEKTFFSGWAQSFYPHGKRLNGGSVVNKLGHGRDVPGAFENQAQVETTNVVSLSLPHSWSLKMEDKDPRKWRVGSRTNFDVTVSQCTP